MNLLKMTKDDPTRIAKATLGTLGGAIAGGIYGLITGAIGGAFEYGIPLGFLIGIVALFSGKGFEGFLSSLLSTMFWVAILSAVLGGVTSIFGGAFLGSQWGKEQKNED
tara:strand:- start:389 stop:715 length:327 start_codon:yes stop_codon:yes gene_type:complete